MKIVITNDDGFGEPGIEALQKILQALGEVVVVAPKRPHPLNGSEPVDYVLCPLDRNAHDDYYVKDGDAYRYQGIIHERSQDVGRDVDVCFGGRIAVTKLSI